MNLTKLFLTGVLAATTAFVAAPAFAGNDCNHGAKATTAEFTASDYTDAPLRFEIVYDIRADADRVFAIMSDHENLAEWLPKLEEVRVDYSGSVNAGRNGAGTVRECVFNGKQVVETIPHYDANSRIYAYSVDMSKSTIKMPFKDHLAVVRVNANTDGTSTVVWQQYIELKKGPKAVVIGPYLKGLMKKGLRNLEAKVETEGATDVVVRR